MSFGTQTGYKLLILSKVLSKLAYQYNVMLSEILKTKTLKYLFRHTIYLDIHFRHLNE